MRGVCTGQQAPELNQSAPPCIYAELLTSSQFKLLCSHTRIGNSVNNPALAASPDGVVAGACFQDSLVNEMHISVGSFVKECFFFN